MDDEEQFDNPEIKTKSIERTLLPLIQQISTLVNHQNECHDIVPINSASSPRTLRALARVAEAVSLAVDRFVTVGETIADENPEIREEMYESCREARASGSTIEKICQAAARNNITDQYSLVRAARCLLHSVTRVLLIADIVVVKQLLLTQDKVARSLGKLEGVGNFTEFVKAFAHFGSEMVELAHLTADRHDDLRDSRRRAQMAAARQVLERSTFMLLTASKTCLRHPESASAKENRDTVFCQMRRAMDLIHYVVKDGVLHCAAKIQDHDLKDAVLTSQMHHTEEDWDSNNTAFGALKHFETLIELIRLTSVVKADSSGVPTASTSSDNGARDRLVTALERIIERTQEFTDSAYTSHEHRENILLLCERARHQLLQFLHLASSQDRELISETGRIITPSELESSLSIVLSSARELRAQLQATSIAQTRDLSKIIAQGSELINLVRNSSLTSDKDCIEKATVQFSEHLEHVLEICKLTRHIAPSDVLQISAKYTEINIRIYGPQVLAAANILASYPSSLIAKENYEVFADMWIKLMGDVKFIARDIIESCRISQFEKPVYLSLPRPGKHGTTSKPLKPITLDSEEQAKIAKSGLEMKLISSEIVAETNRWQQQGASRGGSNVCSGGAGSSGGGGGGGGNSGYNDDTEQGTNIDHENNDIVKRAKNMSSMAFSMYQFTRGEGALKTTQDLFTQAEYFAEEANRLYKVIRLFSYQVPAGANKKQLLAQLDGIPTHVQQLQFTVKSSTVGKSATFTKVDAVINQTKSLMNVIAKVVSTCFLCATKYNLDFRGLDNTRSGNMVNSGMSFGRDDQEGGGGSSGQDSGKMGATGGGDPSI